MSLKLRTDLEIQPISYRGQKALLISDRLGLIKKPIILQGEALEVLALIDGGREAEDIQLEFLRRRGYSLTGASLVSQILDEFKKLWLLDTSEFQEQRKALIQEFSALPLRKAALAGEVYPEAPQELMKLVEQIIRQEELPPEIKSCLVASRKPKVLIAPHIDLRSGLRLYSLAYRCVEGFSFKKILLLGTGHSPETGLMSLTEKDFATPLGTVSTDKEAVKKLKEAAGNLATPHDLAHQREHSLEFQLLFLQHLLGNDFKLIPILFGSFQPWLEQVNRASAIPGLASFLNQLKDLAS
ncbi:MAG: AmmeMemoRadiSam system protein B, partial [Candidatus Saccharicenans sp.]